MWTVVFRDYGEITEFLTVRSKEFGHWGFPKDHVKEAKNEQETAKKRSI